MTVPGATAEEARALLIELQPAGFEEVEREGELTLAAYTSAAGEALLRSRFDRVDSAEVAADWAERWRSFHRSVRVGRLWVGPPWEEPQAELEAVVIDPGQAFGTGAHATTRLCLELLDLLPRGSLLDVGCGSGVLSVASGRLGFGPIVAVDSDPLAVAATAANAARNCVSVDARLLDALAEPLPAATAAIANLSLEVVTRLLPRLASESVVTAGYLERDRVEPAGYSRVERLVLEGWAADWFRAE